MKRGECTLTNALNQSRGFLFRVKGVLLINKANYYIVISVILDMEVTLKDKTVNRKDFKTDKEFITKLIEVDIETFKSLANK